MGWPYVFRAFWIGHHGTIDATYTGNKGKLPELLADEMRNSFRRAELFPDVDGE